VIRKVDTTGTITTFAGSGQSGCYYEGSSYGGDGGPATQAQLSCPFAVAVDSTGNVYIADTYNSVIRKVDTSNIITTVAGVYDNQNYYYDCGYNGYSGDGGPATSAYLNCPTGIGVDAAGNFYIADEGNSAVRVVNTGGSAVTISGVTIQPGNIETIAGDGQPGYSGDGGLATAAQVSYPFGVNVDRFGNINIADEGNSVIRRVDTTGIITTLAGNGSYGYGGDGGPATQATLAEPFATASDYAGDVYIADLENYVVREVGNGSQNAVDFGTVNVGSSSSMTVTLNINSDVTIANVQASGDFFAGLAPSNRRASAHKAAAGTRTVPTLTLKGPVGKLLVKQHRVASPRPNTPGPAPCSGSYSMGDSCTVDVQFTPTAPGARWFPLVVTDSTSHNYSFGLTGTGIASASALTPGTISSVAGDGNSGYSGDGGASTGAELNSPSGMARDSAGNLYIADQGNNVIRKIDSNGNISTVAGNGQGGYTGDGGLATSAQLYSPSDVAIDSAGNLYIADTNNNVIRKVDINGVITTFAGNGQSAYLGDGGPALYASLSGPQGVAVDKAGDLFISDSSNYVVRKIDVNGTITTIAGDNQQGYSGDGAIATAAQLSYPLGVAVDDAGNVYIADGQNYVVRKVGTDGNINTIAGDNQFGYSGDGGAATSAQLSYPNGLKLDGAGNLYIADQYNGVIRMVDGNGNIGTIAGTVGLCGRCDRSNTKGTLISHNQDSGNGDGGPATSAVINLPVGLALDPAGNFYIADHYGDAVRKVDVTASVMAFGSITTGGNATLVATVSNVGTATLDFSLFTIPNGYTQATVGNDCAVGTPVSTATSCAMAMTFSPLVAGIYNGSLSIASDAFQTPQTISLTGSSGSPAVALQFGLPVPPTVPAGVTVGTVPVNVVDGNGDTVTSSTASVTVSITGPNSFSQSNTASAVSGIAEVDFGSTTLTTPGQYTITASSNGLTSATANFTVAAADFSIGASPNSMTLHQGQAGMSTITITPTGGYSGTIQFTCSGMPAYASCVFSPATATMDGSGNPVTVQLTVNTTGTNGVISALRVPGSHGNSFPASIFLMPNALAGILLVGGRKRQSKNARRAMALLILVVVLLGILSLTGCAGSSTAPVHVTPTGSYSASVSATASGGSGSTHSAAVSITIVH
jgi:sugar lactone lactonase YvrE